jgi:Permuted papain-like amidase enzyme, YaeF/YiiX, C92 family
VRAELPSIPIRLLNALASYLAQPVKRHAASPTADPQDLAAVLVHGDVLLTDGNTRVAALVRRVTRSPWSHVAMYVGPLEAGPDPRCIVEADIAAGVRAVRLSELKGLRVRVLRRRGLDDAQRRQLAGWVVGRIGGQYDLAHALALAKRLLLPPLASRPAPAPAATAHAATRFICSTLLAQAFLLVGSPIVPDHSYVTPRDFETAAGLEPVATAAGW